MAKSSIRRSKTYERKLDVPHIADQLEKAKADMMTLNAMAQEEMSHLEERTRVILGEKGIPTMDYPKYLNFTRQVWKLRRSFIAETLKNEIDILIYKWSHRGADEQILDRIRLDVFGVDQSAEVETK